MHYRWSPRNVNALILPLAAGAAYLYLQLNLVQEFGVAPFWFIVAVAAAAAAWWGAEELWEGRHRGDLQAFADRHGWEYQEGTPEYRQRFRSYPFNAGTAREDVDFLRGTFHGRTCATYTRRFDVGSEDSAALQSFQITMVELPVKLPTLDVVPEGLMDRISKRLGGRDIDFESADFNAAWRVKCNDARYAHAMLHPRMLHRLNRYDASGYAIRFEERAVMMWTAERQGTDTLARRLGVLTALAGLVPSHLEREYLELELAEERAAAELLAEQERVEQDAPVWARTPGALTGGYQKAQQARGLVEPELAGPLWAITPGALTTGKYTGQDVETEQNDASRLSHDADGH